MKQNEIAAIAALSMILEVSAYPKPGNVHRTKDFEKTSFENFLASAVAAQEVFQKNVKNAQEKKPFEFGKLFYEAVLKSKSMQNGGNTHFGTFLLLLPLSYAAAADAFEFSVISDICNKKAKNIRKNILRKASEICRQTTFEDAVGFYEAYRLLEIPIQKIEKNSTDQNFDLANPASLEKIKLEETSLFDLMAMGASRDMIAMEWTTDFEKTNAFSKKLKKNKMEFDKNPEKCFGSSINSAVIFTFLEFMATYPDTFISTKKDKKTSVAIQEEAVEIWIKINRTKNLKKHIKKINRFDQKLQKQKNNPGSLADIAAAGIFIALIEGMEF